MPPGESVSPKPNPSEPSPPAAVSSPATPATGQPPKLPGHMARLQNFKQWYLRHKRYSLPGSLLLLLILLVALPWTRYPSLGLIEKKDITIRLQDDESATPVSGAAVMSDGKTAQTNGDGLATLHLPVGPHTFTISKQYYATRYVKLTVPILGRNNPNPPSTKAILVVATGRQVKLNVTNLISGKALPGAQIAIDVNLPGFAPTAPLIKGLTDKNGQAVLVVPPSFPKFGNSYKATLSLSGFNDVSVSIKVGASQLATDNSFKMVPAGKVYFLSKLSGTIDVVKTNLDGSERQTVLAGTGHEDDSGTVLLASRDWKFLALLSRRAGDIAQLYLIDTSTDKMTTIDTGNIEITLVGWSGHYFAYDIVRNAVPASQDNHQALKAYNADNGQLSILDQTQADGTPDDWVSQNFSNYYLMQNDQVAYSVTYSDSVNSTHLAGKNNSIRAVKVNGQNKQDYKSFDATQTNYIQGFLYKPNSIYFEVYDQSGTNNYFSFNGSSVTQLPNGDGFNSDYLTYLTSPGGTQSFWSEPRDGKNTLFVGDSLGAGGKQVASLSDYNTYGWFTDNYLLVSKGSSELYIMPKDGSQPPLKISDYHKPSNTYFGYGGGYGGL